VNNTFFLKNLWLWKCGKQEINYEKKNINMLKKTEWSNEFERCMRNRLLIGSMRYGKLNDNNKKNYNRIEYAIKKLKQYQKSKNKELLVDVANLCLIEFEEGKGVFISFDDKNHVSHK